MCIARLLLLLLLLFFFFKHILHHIHLCVVRSYTLYIVPQITLECVLRSLYIYKCSMSSWGLSGLKDALYIHVYPFFSFFHRLRSLALSFNVYYKWKSGSGIESRGPLLPYTFLYKKKKILYIINLYICMSMWKRNGK